MALLAASQLPVVIKVHAHVLAQRQTGLHADQRGIAHQRRTLDAIRRTATGKAQMLFRFDVGKAVLPAQMAAHIQCLPSRQIERFDRPHTEGAQHCITLIARAFQRRSVALLGEAFGVQMHVSQIGERLQRQRLQVQSISRLTEHLSRRRINLGFLFGADVAVLQIAFHIGAMPAVGRAGAQTPGADFMPGVSTEVIAVDLGRRVRARAHAQRAVAVAGDQTDAGLLVQRAVDTGQQTANRRVVARRVMARIGAAPRAEGLDPAVALRRGGVVQALTYSIAQLAAVVDQHRTEGRVDFAAQLLKGLLRRRGVCRQQHAFVNRIACAQAFDSRGHRTLIRGLADAGERGRVAFNIELDRAGGVIEAAANEQVVRHHGAKLALNTTGRLQDVVLATEQALRLGGTEQGRAVFQRQADGCAADRGRAAGNNLVAAGR